MGSARLLHFYGEPYEPGLSRALRDRLAPGDVFLDIGANIGYFSVLAGRIVGPAGRVVSFEPHPEARSVLQQAVAANDLAGIIEIVPAAVADRTGVVPLFLTADSVLSTTDPSRSPARAHYDFARFDRGAASHGGRVARRARGARGARPRDQDRRRRHRSRGGAGHARNAGEVCARNDPV
jgi:FkbM family methyltransferase